ncbi:unnamed protein product [Citrullus colocynthis]|uniref:Uncharacterized protein n=1 Tax=Citrullus colocynthis TaxID=252529 RepID=A0ABP0ZAD6_9ROSI
MRTKNLKNKECLGAGFLLASVVTVLWALLESMKKSLIYKQEVTNEVVQSK